MTDFGRRIMVSHPLSNLLWILETFETWLKALKCSFPPKNHIRSPIRICSRNGRLSDRIGILYRTRSESFFYPGFSLFYQLSTNPDKKRFWPQAKTKKQWPSRTLILDIWIDVHHRCDFEGSDVVSTDQNEQKCTCWHVVFKLLEHLGASEIFQI